ncbi:MAG: YicC/YloC family endoribonuclease [Candidatus Omnitrophota bacterium]|nr:YicC/YloC family endoribonuclease [Candidatus Omnitrophota bacterium]
MIKGMTGFAQSQFSFQGVKGNVEIKSLNSRHFETVSHLAPGFNAFEDKIKKIVGRKIKRGRINVVINFLTPVPRGSVVLNESVAREYVSKLKHLKRSLKVKDTISLSQIINLPGVLSLEEKQISLPSLWLKIEAALNHAMDVLLKARLSEGRCLGTDIAKWIKQIHGSIRQMQKRAQTVIAKKTQELTTEELSAFLKSSNINEELARLNFHLDSLKKRLKSNDSVGKELDFICQELLREINTAGAKLADKDISACAIQIKSGIEKIREQAQNIE